MFNLNELIDMLRKIKNILILILFLVSSSIFAQDPTVSIKAVNRFNQAIEGILVKANDDVAASAVTNKEGYAQLTNKTGITGITFLSPAGARYSVILDKVPDDTLIVIIDKDRDREIHRAFNIKGRNISNTAAIAVSDNSNLRSSTINPANSLYGMLSGLFVMQGANVAWNNDPTLSVRGIGTLNSSKPLILVDGFERPINSLSHDEIESVSVLKDAAALSLYGMRGANGVVLVTTKRGSYQGMQTKASYQLSINTPFRLPKMADGYNYALAMNEALELDGLEPIYRLHDLSAFQTGSHPELFPNVDWINESLRNKGFTHQANVSFQGGNSKVRYYSTLNYQGDNGFIKPVDLNPDYNTQMSWDRLSLRTNLDILLTKTTKLKLNLLGQLSQYNRPTVNYSNLFPIIYTAPSAAFPIKTSTGVWGGSPIYKNPVAEISARGFTTGNDRSLFADMRIEQDLSAWLKGLSAEVAFAYDNQSNYLDGRSKNYLYEVLNAQRDNNGNIEEINRDRYGQETDLSFSSSLGYQNQVTTIEAKINYQNQWSKEHVLHTSLLFHSEENSLMGQNNTYRRLNTAGNINYGYLEKYFVDLSLSLTGSSVLNENDKYRLFPALSGAWIISSEEFMASFEAIDFLKLRASWGITGSDLLDYNLGRHFFTIGGYNYYFGANNNSQNGNSEGRLATQDLNPEISRKANVGVDMRIFNNLTLTADLFQDRRKDIIVSSDAFYSSVIGIETPLVNAGKIINRGFEVTLGWEDRLQHFSYHARANFSFARNKIINMNEMYQPYDYLKRTGHRVGQFFGLEAEGFFNNSSEITNAPDHTYSQVRIGDVKYKDQNGDNLINNYDMLPQGYSTILPEIYYGFNVGIGYKGFTLNAVFQGIDNFSVIKNMPNMYRVLRNNTNISEHYLSNRWTPDNHNAKYPRLSTLDNSNNYQNSSIWLENGAYLKLRNIELMYSLPESLTSKVKADMIQIFVRGNNLFSFDNIKEVDPELMYQSYPSFASYHIGFNVQF